MNYQTPIQKRPGDENYPITSTFEFSNEKCAHSLDDHLKGDDFQNTWYTSSMRN